ncbi:hypothetical protein GNI_043100 [Gregarina niphandrodes]|uniref:Uncharacterized protein n=1 Tax=Gregarina niphandrodes TaxID=110365 RepID=A0A023BA09_GRENI|nr:hypothetical protein GNI_043100 [Gregarina niphandrodes]EZG77196.1 hypothetical protein GNI_043100 [Gregarina niphandrodes]|eukprot:XP_011129532.1 hypothetical protein GNI_043100 [Gregarina niphandrodes]
MKTDMKTTSMTPRMKGPEVSTELKFGTTGQHTQEQHNSMTPNAMTPEACKSEHVLATEEDDEKDHQILLHTFQKQSNGRMSNTLKEMLQSRAMMMKEYKELEANIRSEEADLLSYSELMAVNYRSVFDQIKVMCPDVFEEDDPMPEALAINREKVPWLDCLHRDNVFTPPTMACSQAQPTSDGNQSTAANTPINFKAG